MHKTLILLTVATVSLSGCQKSAAPSAPSGAASGAITKSGDPVQQKLQELAGSGATNCGRLQSQAPESMKSAGDCAMQAVQSKHAFYVAYDMPGLTVGVAGDAAGKLSFVQAAQLEKAQSGTSAAVTSGPCPAALRVALSGRITCLPAGAMGTGHGGVSMPPAGGESPHGGMSMPPPGTPNPHAGKAPATVPKKN